MKTLELAKKAVARLKEVSANKHVPSSRWEVVEDKKLKGSSHSGFLKLVYRGHTLHIGAAPGPKGYTGYIDRKLVITPDVALYDGAPGRSKLAFKLQEMIDTSLNKKGA